MRKKPLGIGLLVLAFILLLAAILLCPPSPMRSGDEGAAFATLATAPIPDLVRTGSGHMIVHIPDDGRWRRIRRAWGDPGYLLTVELAQEQLVCLAQLPLAFALTRDMKSIEASPAPEPVYGYSTDCLPEGLVFHAPPGSTLEIRVSVKTHPAAPLQGDLIVLPYWKSNVKDSLVTSSLTQTFEPVCKLLAICAAAALITAVCVLFRRSNPARA